MDLVDEVSFRYNTTLKLEQQLNNISLITQELDLMQESVKGVCNKIDKLNEFYNNVVTEQHNARMMHEKNEQNKFLNEEKQKCKKELKDETEKCKEYHNILKIQEVAKRNKDNNDDNNVKK